MPKENSDSRVSEKKQEIELKKMSAKAEKIMKAPDELIAMAIRDAILKDKADS